MTIKALYPNIEPSLNLSFALTKALDPRITFARASTATYYNGVTTAKAEENLLLQSQTLDVSPWLTVAASVTANTSTAPDGTSTADKLTPDATSAAHYVRQVVTGTAQTYAYSVFAKADGYSWLQLWDAFNTEFANFDVTNGVTGQVSAGVTSSITSVGSGWYRCTIVKSLTAASQQMRIGVYDSDANRNASFTGNGTDGILIWGAQLEQRSAVTAYTPTTTQPITNYVPVLLSAANNVARFDHNPVTGESLGLLIEEQRTNLFVRSEEFQTTWATTRASITVNTLVAPDGTLTGDKLVEDTSATTTHFVSQAGVGTISAGGTITSSAYVKAGERTDCSLLVSGATFSDRFEAIFNLANGTVRSTNAAGTGSVAGATITAVGNGWYRVTATGVSGSSNTVCAARIQTADSTGSTSYTGNGFSGIYIWGAQLEAGAFPTSYIPTVASQVTRSADAASMTGANFSSWYNAAEGTLYSDAAYVGLTVSRAIVSINDNLGNNFIQIQTNPSTATTGRFFVSVNNTSQVVSNVNSAFAAGSFGKLAAAYKPNDFAFTSNGATVVTDTDGILPSVSQLQFGAYVTVFSSVHIRKVAYYPKRLANAELQALTT